MSMSNRSGNDLPVLFKPMGMDCSTANSPSKPFNVINTELTQGRTALSIRISSITGKIPRLTTLLTQCCQSVNQQFALVVAQIVYRFKLVHNIYLHGRQYRHGCIFHPKLTKNSDTVTPVVNDSFCKWRTDAIDPLLPHLATFRASG